MVSRQSKTYDSDRNQTILIPSKPARLDRALKKQLFVQETLLGPVGTYEMDEVAHASKCFYRSIGRTRFRNTIFY